MLTRFKPFSTSLLIDQEAVKHAELFSCIQNKILRLKDDITEYSFKKYSTLLLDHYVVALWD